jgi:Matrixin
MTSFLVLAARLLLGQTDAGYVREHTADGAHCLRWPVRAGSTGDLTFVQSAAGDVALGPGLFDAVSRSEGSWAAQAGLCSSLTMREGARSASRIVGYDPGGPNENLVLVRTTDCSRIVGANDPCRASGTCANAHDCWDQGAGLLALTLLTYDGSGALLDSDIEINGDISYLSLVDAPPCTPGNVIPPCVGNDVQNIVTHELGHALGLGHSPDPSSTMYATAPLGETSKRILDPASRQFVCDVYPPGLASRDCSLPDGGTQPVSDAGGGPAGSGPSPGSGPTGPGIARTTASCAVAAGPETGSGALLAGALAAAILASSRRATRRRCREQGPVPELGSAVPRPPSGTRPPRPSKVPDTFETATNSGGWMHGAPVARASLPAPSHPPWTSLAKEFGTSARSTWPAGPRSWWRCSPSE